ncbi:Vacuolar amino acid transporter [Penicillium chrysogenum]|jgi:proton-coupled amino acid transporter|nr:Vacuolar amino acid transporter [Penicillium chrysogenum]
MMADTRAPEHPDNTGKVISRHLHPRFTGAYDGITEYDGDVRDTQATDYDGNRRSTFIGHGQQSSLKLQGGDIHRDLYRTEARLKRAGLDQRAATFSHPPRLETDDDLDITIHGEPGAFRRQFLRRNKRDFANKYAPNSFVEFLELYGRFAGEDLIESEDETDVESAGIPGNEVEPEIRPLLPIRESSQGDASDMKTFFTLLKAFIGTGIIFLPKAFRNGGMLFSSIALVTVSILTTISFHLLLQCQRRYGGGYGDIGESISSSHLRSLIRLSIATTQLGFVCAAIAFTANNLRSFIEGVATYNINTPSISTIIALQLVIIVPLAFIRKISRLGPVALLADVFIFIAIGYIYYYDISEISQRGLQPTVKLFDSNTFTLTIGSSIFMFEGIGLILPIQSSMSQPDRFDHILYIVMALITFLFATLGILSYGAFGSQTKINIISNFPQSDKFVNSVRLLFSLAVLVGTPVQLFPALRIMERKLFGRKSGQRDLLIKWKKNTFRTGIVVLCALVAALGARDLDKFVALVGSISCVPLIFVYPAYLHWKGIATTWWEKGGDMLIITVGVACMVYTTMVTVFLQFN